MGGLDGVGAELAARQGVVAPAFLNVLRAPLRRPMLIVESWAYGESGRWMLYFMVTRICQWVVAQ